MEADSAKATCDHSQPKRTVAKAIAALRKAAARLVGGDGLEPPTLSV
jgi:hypothetical protein